MFLQNDIAGTVPGEASMPTWNSDPYSLIHGVATARFSADLFEAFPNGKTCSAGWRWMPLPQLKESAKPAVDRHDSKRRLVLSGPTFSSSDHNREKNMEGCRLNMAQTSSRNDGRKIERSAIIIFSTMNMKVYTSPYGIFDFLGKCHMLSCSRSYLELGKDDFQHCLVY